MVEGMVQKKTYLCLFPVKMVFRLPLMHSLRCLARRASAQHLSAAATRPVAPPARPLLPLRSAVHSAFSTAVHSTAALAPPAAAPHRPALRGLDHVCVAVADVDRSIVWYRAVLGFEHVFADDPSFGKDPAFMQQQIYGGADVLVGDGDGDGDAGDDGDDGDAGVRQEAQLGGSSGEREGSGDRDRERSGGGGGGGQTAQQQPRGMANRPAAIALLPIPAGGGAPIANHRGAHFAVNSCGASFAEWRRRLPGLLEEHQSGRSDGEVDYQDYGMQRSLFFADPDRNIVEITTWE